MRKDDAHAISEWFKRLKDSRFENQLTNHRLMTLAKLLSRLKRVSQAGGGWSACCPAHADSRPSLSVNVSDDGKFLVYCHANCKFEKIVSALGMESKEMFEGGPNDKSAILPPRVVSNLVKDLAIADPVWREKQEACFSSVNDGMLRSLANHLGVSTESLRAIGVGWSLSDKCWTFPEYNGHQEICGIIRRYPRGEKIAMRGSNRGLTLPLGWQNSKNPLFICEGQTDVAAALSSGRRAIGRPGINKGLEDLVVLLSKETEPLILVADNDRMGQGIIGAKKLADNLSYYLGKKVDVVAPIKGFKDLREVFVRSAK